MAFSKPLCEMCNKHVLFIRCCLDTEGHVLPAYTDCEECVTSPCWIKLLVIYNIQTLENITQHVMSVMYSYSFAFWKFVQIFSLESHNFTALVFATYFLCIFSWERVVCQTLFSCVILIYSLQSNIFNINGNLYLIPSFTTEIVLFHQTV